MDEYISREETINAIKSLESSMPAKDNYAKGYDAALGRVLIAVREVPPATDVQPVNQWISVGDELPEWDKTVLVWYASDTLFGVCEGYGLSWYHGSWRLNDLYGENIRIFYWRYLPEKPKGGTMNNDL